jgi:hypothetical protein
VHVIDHAVDNAIGKLLRIARNFFLSPTKIEPARGKSALVSTI